MTENILDSAKNPCPEILEMTFSGLQEECLEGLTRDYDGKIILQRPNEILESGFDINRLRRVPAKWEIFFTMGLDESIPALPYNRIIILLNCNVKPTTNMKTMCEILPVWHAAVVCLYDGIPQRIMMVKETKILTAIYTQFPPQDLRLGDGSSLKDYIGNIPIETYDIKEDPAETRQYNENSAVSILVGWPNRETRDKFRHVLEEYDTSVYYLLNTPVLNTCLHHVAMSIDEERTILIQYDRVVDPN